MKRILSSLAICFIVFVSIPSSYAVDEPTVTTIVTPAGDDSSYRIPLTVPVVYDGVTYQDVYATTNSVITFGRPDGTFWDYPATPSISVESRDWWALPTQMPDTHFILNVSAGGFQVDGAYRPYGTITGDTTSIIITAQIQTDGTVAYTYAVSGPLYGGERTGARLVDGTVVTLEEAGITEVEVPPVLEPEPIAPVQPEPEVVEPTPPAPTPSPVVNPIPMPSFEPPVVEPTPEPTPEPLPIPVEPPTEVEEVPTEPIPEPEPTAPEPPAEPTQPEPASPETVTLDNGVILAANVAQALELFGKPAELLSEIFSNPAQVLTAFANIGADMSPEVRERAEEVVIAAIIVGQIATQAAVSAAAGAAYRRKP